jgi:hypothetical protein
LVAPGFPVISHPDAGATEQAVFDVKTRMFEPLYQGFVMGGDDHGRADLVQLFKQVHQPDRDIIVDITRWFVGKQYLRPRDHRPGDRNALLLAARQSCRFVIYLAFKSHPFQQFCDVIPNLAFLGARDPSGNATLSSADK